MRASIRDLQKSALVVVNSNSCDVTASAIVVLRQFNGLA